MGDFTFLEDLPFSCAIFLATFQKTIHYNLFWEVHWRFYMHIFLDDFNILQDAF